LTSVGIFYDAQKLLRLVKTGRVTTAALLESFRKLEVADLSEVLRISQQCQWIELDAESMICLTDRGRALHDLTGSPEQLRYQLRDLLHFSQPSWAKKLADGRSEATKIMPDAIRQIFLEAGLLGDWTDDLIAWWDTIALAARNQKNERNLKTGRAAEKLSLLYEEARTGHKPKWTCAETNYAGFDILSIVAREEPRPCAIEVKGSTQRLKEAFFNLSRSEWNTAEDNPDYRIHLWLIRSEAQDHDRDLRVVTTTELRKHIPTDLGEGRWAIVAVPYRPFWA
jgi:hypothetical protein